MDFGKNDLIILIVMTLSVVLIAFIFPELGLTTQDDVAESEIPEFSINASRFNFADEFPNAPGTPTTGTLWWEGEGVDGTGGANFSDQNVWLKGDTASGVEMVLLPNTDISQDPEILINYWDGGVVDYTDSVNFNSTGEEMFISNDTWEFRYEAENVTWTDKSQDDFYLEVDYRVIEQPVSDGGWIGRIPIVGTAYSATEATAATLAWFASIVRWGLGTFYETALNLLGALFDVLTYTIDLASFITGEYGAVIDSADSWAKVFVAVPGILGFYELAKLTFIAISLLPTT